MRTIRSRDLSIEFLSKNLVYFLLIPLIFGRIGSFLQLLPSFSARVNDMGILEKLATFVRYFFSVWEGGLDPTWIVMGFLIIFVAVAISQKEPIFKWLDAFVSPGLLLVIFVHIGGFFSAWGYGRPVSESFPLSISYDLQHVRFSGPLYPVQIYGVILFFALFIIGRKICRKSLFSRTKWKDGTFFGVMTFFATMTNGFLEFFRGDAVKIVFDTIRLPQIISFGIAFVALIFLAVHTHEIRKIIKTDKP